MPVIVIVVGKGGTHCTKFQCGSLRHSALSLNSSDVPAAVAGRRRGIRAALHVPSQAAPAQAVPAHVVPAQAQAELGPDGAELRAAVAALLANADAWRDADPHRRFSPALRALAQAYAGSSYAVMAQAAQSLLSVLSREPLTHSPAVAATAGRLRGLFSPRPQLARGLAKPCSTHREPRG